MLGSASGTIRGTLVLGTSMGPRWLGRIFLAFPLSLCISAASLAGYGELDTGFGSNGVASISWGELRAVAVQPDGKVIAAGTRDANRAILYRLHAAGNVDVVFGANGLVEVASGLPAIDVDSAEAVRIQPDGKILVGLRGRQYYAPVFITLRLNADGSPDPSWGSGGMATAPTAAGHELFDIVLQPDGKVLALGFQNVEVVAGSGTTRRRIRIHRYTASGQLDASFGIGGVFAFDRPGDTNDFARKLVLAPSGRIYAAGNGPFGIRILALNASGAFEPGWGNGGVLDSPFGDGNGRGAALTGDGALVVVGICGAMSCVERYHSDGTIDTTFGQSGRATFSIASGGAPMADSVHALAGGDLLVAGDAWPSFANVLPYGQLLDASGNQDPAYNSSGLNVVSSAPMNVRASALLPGNALLVAGWRTRPNSAIQDIFLVRLQGDLVPPETSITSGPPPLTSETMAQIAFVSSEPGSTFECSGTGSPVFVACSSPATLSGLADGPHEFQVRAIGAIGNVDATPASWNWSVDTVVPETALTDGPSGTVGSASATFAFGSDDPGATFECRLDGSPYGSCTSPHNVPGLAQGLHVFDVRAVDAAGNIDASPASRTWTVDTVAPDTTIASGPSGNNNRNPVAFTFTSSESGGSFECRMDTGAFEPCASPKSYSGLAKGQHSFQVRARDAAGNTDATPATRNFGVK